MDARIKKNSIELVFLMLKATICGCEYKITDEVDLNYVELVAIEGKIEAIIGEKMADLCPERGENWMKRSRKIGMKQLDRMFALKGVLNGLLKIGIEPVVFKGPAIASLYPSQLLRYSGDVDLKIKEYEVMRVHDELIRMGAYKDEASSKPHVGVFVFPGGLKLEVHELLWEEPDMPGANILASLQLDEDSSFIHTSYLGFKVKTLGVTEHLIYMMFHTVKHFCYKGITLKNLSDICVYVNAYVNRINWERFSEAMVKLGYTKFVKTIFTLCTEKLGMKNVPGFESEGAESAEKTMLALYDLVFLRDGIENNPDAANAFVYQGKFEGGAKKGRLSLIAAAVFPKSKNLSPRYAYARRIKFLLPIAWVHRALSILIRKLSGHGALKDSYDLAVRKVRFLNKLGL